MNGSSTVWSQNFTYDAFGNLAKSGTISFNAGYVNAQGQTTNRVVSVGSVTPTYDANGNLQNDGVQSYTWDADGNPITLPSRNVTYDALDRPAEMSVGSTYYQFAYSPTGRQLAIMNGQNMFRALAPLPGGGQVAYTSNTQVAWYRHPDWLGSSRFDSTPSRTMFYDGAYAPFGENYSETGTADRSFTSQGSDIVGTGSYPLYNFPMREQHEVWGRWLSPDPAGLAAVDLTNPQSLNRYAYALNNPTTFTDPLGLCPGCPPGQQGNGAALTCGHPGMTVPQGENPQTWCYNHMGIGGGSSFSAFFTNTGDEFDLMGLAFAAANEGTFYFPCPYGDCGWKTQPIWLPTYSPAAISDLLDEIMLVSTPTGSVTYQPGAGLNTNDTNAPSTQPNWENMPENTNACHAQALEQDYAPGMGGFVSAFSLYNFTGNFPITLGVEAVKYGLPALGMALGKPALQAAGAGLSVASGALTATATVMDARARYECGQRILP